MQTLRRYMPDCAITTDVIIGFPGETEAEFAETLGFVAGVGLSRMHVFPYSRREGTAGRPYDRSGGWIAVRLRVQKNYSNWEQTGK